MRRYTGGMLKLYLAFLLLLTASCGGSGCADATVETLKRIDSTVSSADGAQLSKGKYVALVADARAKFDHAQLCMSVAEQNGELNEHLRNTVIYYDEAVDVWESGSNPRVKEYWQLAHEEISKIK